MAFLATRVSCFLHQSKGCHDLISCCASFFSILDNYYTTRSCPIRNIYNFKPLSICSATHPPIPHGWFFPSLNSINRQLLRFKSFNIMLLAASTTIRVFLPLPFIQERRKLTRPRSKPRLLCLGSPLIDILLNLLLPSLFLLFRLILFSCKGRKRIRRHLSRCPIIKLYH